MPRFLPNILSVQGMFAGSGENYPSLALSYHDVGYLAHINRDYPRFVKLEEDIHMTCWAYSWLFHHFVVAHSREVSLVQRALRESNEQGIKLTPPLSLHVDDKQIPDETRILLKRVQNYEEANGRILKKLHLPLHAIVLCFLDEFVSGTIPMVESRVKSEEPWEPMEHVGEYFRGFSPAIRTVYAKYREDVLSMRENEGLRIRYFKLKKVMEMLPPAGFSKLLKFILNPTFPTSPPPRPPDAIFNTPSENMDARLETVYQVVSQHAGDGNLAAMDAELQVRLHDTIEVSLTRMQNVYLNAFIEQTQSILNSPRTMNPAFHPFEFYNTRQRDVAKETGTKADDIFVISSPLSKPYRS
jgi:hypothetical protein